VVNVAPSASMTVRFRGNGIALIARTGPDGGRLLARLDGSTINQLPTDENGDSFVDLRTDEEAWGQRLLLVDGLPLDEHTLELTVASAYAGAEEDLTCIIDGFTVLAASHPVFPTIPVIVLGLLVTGLAGLVVWEQRRRRR